MATVNSRRYQWGVQGTSTEIDMSRITLITVTSVLITVTSVLITVTSVMTR